MGRYTHGIRKQTSSVWPKPSINSTGMGPFNAYDMTYIADISRYAIIVKNISVKDIKAELKTLYGVERVNEIPEHFATNAVLFFFEFGKAIGYPYVDEI